MSAVTISKILINKNEEDTQDKEDGKTKRNKVYILAMVKCLNIRG